MNPPPHILICHLTHIYGRDPQLALGTLRQGASPEVIFQSTGRVVALRDISLEIGRGELLVIYDHGAMGIGQIHPADHPHPRGAPH